MTTLVAAQTGGLGGAGMFLYFGALALLFYFLMIRPNKKRQQEAQKMHDELRPGIDVVTRSGVKGRVVEVDDVYFLLETGNGSQITFLKEALAYIVTPVTGLDETENNSDVDITNKDSQLSDDEEKYLEKNDEL